VGGDAVPARRRGVARGFDIKVTLHAPIAVKEIASPVARIDVDGSARRTARRAAAAPTRREQPRLHPELPAGRRPHRVRPDAVRGDDENFFLAMVSRQGVSRPPDRPREYIFVVDISGSMHGYPLDTAKVLLQHLIGGLRPSDTFNVMLFSGSNRMLAAVGAATTRQHRTRAAARSRRWAAAAAPRSCRRSSAWPRCRSAPTCSRSVSS
jgi:Ca-activated chloride channel family protein